jgi:hypothetical protein
MPSAARQLLLVDLEFSKGPSFSNGAAWRMSEQTLVRDKSAKYGLSSIRTGVLFLFLLSYQYVA